MHSLFTSAQVEEPESSITGRLVKLSLMILDGGAAAYYFHTHHPDATPTLLSNIRPQTL